LGVAEGKIYFFRKGANLGGGRGTDGHPHVCVRLVDRVLVMAIMSSQVGTTREQLLRWGRVSEQEVPIISMTPSNRLTKPMSYVECYNAYECGLGDFMEAVRQNLVVDTGGELSDTDMLAVAMGVLRSDQVPEEIKDLLR